MAAAKANGIRLIVALYVNLNNSSRLEMHWFNIIYRTNNWSDYGGMDVYVKQILNSPDHDLFYTNTAVIVSTTFMNIAIFSPLIIC